MAFPMLRALYDVTMYSLIFIIGSLVGMEIPIIMGVLADKKSTRDSIANVMSLDYIGALIGSIMFPLFLLPQLGLIQSSFAIGLISIFTALTNIYFLREYLSSPRLLTFLGLAVLALLVSFTIFGTQLTSYAEKHLYFDQIIYKKQTPYQKIIVTKSVATNEHRLYIDGHIQFSSRDEYRYHESLVHPLMSVSGARSRVLVLGGGDGLAVREILKYKDVKEIHLVDIDPEMTAISKRLNILSTLPSSLHLILIVPGFVLVSSQAVSMVAFTLDKPTLSRCFIRSRAEEHRSRACLTICLRTVQQESRAARPIPPPPPKVLGSI